MASPVASLPARPPRLGRLLALAAASLVGACRAEPPVGRMTHPPLLPGADPRLERYPPEIRRAIRARQVVRGMDPDAVRLAWGAPDEVERTPSATAAGLEYQRWTWLAAGRSPARAVWFAEDRVVDVVGPGSTGPPP